jgi:hypothetical protein
LRATATIAHSMLDCLAIRRPQARNADHFTDSQQQARGRFIQRLPNRNIALFANTAFIVDRRSRLVSPRRQAKMHSNRSRSRKAPGIIYSHFGRKGGNGTDTRHRHQAAANRVMLNHLKNHSMQSFVAIEDCPPYIQHGLNHHRKYWIAVLEQLPDACRAPNPFARIGS